MNVVRVRLEEWWPVPEPNPRGEYALEVDDETLQRWTAAYRAFGDARAEILDRLREDPLCWDVEKGLWR
jgi:hypothetical protein